MRIKQDALHFLPPFSEDSTRAAKLLQRLLPLFSSKRQKALNPVLQEQPNGRHGKGVGCSRQASSSRATEELPGEEPLGSFAQAEFRFNCADN